MNERSLKNVQPEQMLNSEQTADDTSVSHANGNTNVSGSASVPQEAFEEVCQKRDELNKKVKEYYDHIGELEKQIIEMIRLRKKEYFNFVAQLNAIKLFFDVTEKAGTHRQKELFSQTAKGVIDAKTEELIRQFNDYRFRVNRSKFYIGDPKSWQFQNIPNDDDLPF